MPEVMLRCSLGRCYSMGRPAAVRLGCGSAVPSPSSRCAVRVFLPVQATAASGCSSSAHGGWSMPSTLPQRLPAVAGIATLALLLLITLLLPETARGVLRDSAYDIVLDADQRIWVARQAELPVIVVDIDRPSIEAFGPWPWPRQTIARLVEAVAARRPAAIAIDVLFAEADDRSPAALARRLGALTDRPEISALAEKLPDGDKQLADAVKSAPVVVGFVLDPDLDSTLLGP